MLRILVFDEPFTLKVRAEGVLDHESLQQFQQALADAELRCDTRRFLVDVGDLALADHAAESAILKSRERGIQFVAARARIAELLHNQEQQDCHAHCGLLRRLVFRLTSSCESSPRPICAKLYKFMHTDQLPDLRPHERV